MKQKAVGGMMVLIGLVSGIYGIILIGPVVWLWMVSVATGVADIVSNNARAFAAFQETNPAVVGLGALLIGLAFCLLGFTLSRASGPDTAASKKHHPPQREAVPESERSFRAGPNGTVQVP